MAMRSILLEQRRTVSAEVFWIASSQEFLAIRPRRGVSESFDFAASIPISCATDLLQRIV
jgi:hypothetical protein